MGRPENEQEPLFRIRRGDAEGPYLISSYAQDRFALAELTPEEQSIMDKQTHTHPVRDIFVSSGSALANIGVATTAMTAGMPLWALITGEVATLGASIGVQGGSIYAAKRTIRRQRKITENIAAEPSRYMEFSLLENALEHFSRECKPAFLSASMGSIERMYGSARQLPRHDTDAEDLPEGVRRLDERHKAGLLIGSLGVYGVLRAQVGIAVSESIGDLYAIHGGEDLKNDPLLKDATLFSAPTENNLTWRQIDQTRSYIRYTQPLDS